MHNRINVISHEGVTTVYINEEEIFTGNIKSQEFKEVFASKMGWVYIKESKW